MKPSKSLPIFSFKNPSRNFYVYESEVTLNEVTVQHEGRRLRATWTPELAQDIQAYHNIDVEAEITTLLAEELARGIDNEILQTLMTNQTNHIIEETPINLDIKPSNELRRHFLIEPISETTQDFEFPILPIARRVAAQTMALDLIPVQPMENATGGLFYFQPQIVGEPTVFDDGSWYLGNTFESVFIQSTIKNHEFS
jgi:hypothetical protein